MYPPAMSYEVYKIERGLTLTGSDWRAADERAGEMAAALGRQWRALVRLVTLAAGRDALRRWNVSRCNAAGHIPLHAGAPGGANVVAISAHKTSKYRLELRRKICSTCLCTQ